MPYTLLLADDSVTIQRVVELTFAGEDISVVAVSDGDHAMASIQHAPPDIVLADVGMPGRSGYEVARHIKHTPGLSHIPVLLLAGAFEPVDPERALEAGCDGVVTKPFEPHVLVQRVKDLLAGANVHAPAAVPAVAEVLQPRPQAVAQLDDYFEQLDQAFAARVAEVLPPVPEPEPASPPLAGGTPVHVAVPLATGAAEPLLAGAFSALLEAEKAGAAPDAFADWLPEEPEPLPLTTAALSEETIEAIVRRVLDRLSETVVREAVSAIALATAERLVREEIERIKSNIK